MKNKLSTPIKKQQTENFKRNNCFLRTVWEKKKDRIVVKFPLTWYQYPLRQQGRERSQHLLFSMNCSL